MPAEREDPADLSGQVLLRRYRLVAPLAEGGMGVIYLARQEGDAGFMRPAVIKRLRPEIGADQSMVELFMREARIMSRLQHPGIVGVLDFAVESGCHVMALEYVAGYHVGLWSRYLKKVGKAFDPELAIFIVSQVLDTLDYVHARTDESGAPMGIVHRDVTPSNVVIDREGIVKLLDFGIARSEEEATKDASERSIKGKFSYLAPEILDGAPPTGRGDIYSCAVMLHALIWGRNPFLASTPAETLRRVLKNDLPPLLEHYPNIPPGLDAVLKRATSRDPDHRPQTAAELSAELRALLTTDERALAARLRDTAREVSAEDALPQVLMQPTLEEREAKWRHYVASRPPPRQSTSSVPAARRSRWPLAIIALLLVAVAASIGVAVSLKQNGQNTRTIIVEQTNLAGTMGAQPTNVPTTEMGTADPSMMSDPVQTMDMDATMQTSMGSMGSLRPEQQLARSFGRSVPALRRCFEQHGDESTERITVRLTVGRDGRVRNAGITPSNLPGSLRGCLTNVSESARFQRQSEPLTFQVPVLIRRR